MSSTCKDCPAMIAWAKTTKGRMMPLEAERDAAGAVVPVEFDNGNVEPTGDETWGRNGGMVPVVKVVGPGQVALPGIRVLWRSHFSSCPKAEANRRPRRRGGSSTRWDR